MPGPVDSPGYLQLKQPLTQKQDKLPLLANVENWEIILQNLWKNT